MDIIQLEGRPDKVLAALRNHDTTRKPGEAVSAVLYVSHQRSVEFEALAEGAPFKRFLTTTVDHLNVVPDPSLAHDQAVVTFETVGMQNYELLAAGADQLLAEHLGVEAAATVAPRHSTAEGAKAKPEAPIAKIQWKGSHGHRTYQGVWSVPASGLHLGRCSKGPGSYSLAEALRIKGASTTLVSRDVFRIDSTFGDLVLTVSSSSNVVEYKTSRGGLHRVVPWLRQQWERLEKGVPQTLKSGDMIRIRILNNAELTIAELTGRL